MKKDTIGDERKTRKRAVDEETHRQKERGKKSVMDPRAIQKLQKELFDLHRRPIDGVEVHMNEGDVCDVQATYEGPVGTPFEGGMFRMKLILGDDYPNSPPKGKFLTKIFHPNVSAGGEICVNVLKRDWNADVGLRHVLTVIRCLLVEPNAESALNEEAGKLLLDGFDAFAEKAKMMTEIHAMSRQGANQNSAVLNNSTNTKSLPTSPSKTAKLASPKKTVGGLNKKKSLKRL